MNCDEIRDSLPEFVCQLLPAEQSAAIAAHLRECTLCQREADKLQPVAHCLRAPLPSLARVDLPALYAEAARRAALRLRRWRRLAYAAGMLAVAVVLLAIVPRLEVRIEAHQAVVRWGVPPEMPPPIVDAPRTAAEPLDEQLRLVSDLLQALADDARGRDYRRQIEAARLQEQLDDLRQQTVRRWAAAERDIAAMYSVQFPAKKGATP